MKNKLSKLILLSQKIYEESYDKEALHISVYLPRIKFSGYKTDEEACIEACKKLKIDNELYFPIYLLNKYCWNDIQDWAKKQLGENKK